MLLASGLASGLLAGMLGIGGGIVTVPVVYYLCLKIGIDETHLMHIAIATSLASIIITGASSTFSHYKRGSVDMLTIKQMLIYVVFGSFVGAFFATQISGNYLTIFFALMALLVSFHMGFWKFDSTEQKTKKPNNKTIKIAGFFIGSVSSMMGIGGGSLSVPFFSATGYNIRKAIGTSAALGLVLATAGTISYIFNSQQTTSLPKECFGYVHVPMFLIIATASLFSAPIGTKIAHSIGQLLLRRIFAVFLAIAATRMLLKSLSF